MWFIIVEKSENPGVLVPIVDEDWNELETFGSKSEAEVWASRNVLCQPGCYQVIEWRGMKANALEDETEAGAGRS